MKKFLYFYISIIAAPFLDGSEINEKKVSSLKISPIPKLKQNLIMNYFYPSKKSSFKNSDLIFEENKQTEQKRSAIKQLLNEDSVKTDDLKTLPENVVEPLIYFKSTYESCYQEKETAQGDWENFQKKLSTISFKTRLTMLDLAICSAAIDLKEQLILSLKRDACSTPTVVEGNKQLIFANKTEIFETIFKPKKIQPPETTTYPPKQSGLTAVFADMTQKNIAIKAGAFTIICDKTPTERIFRVLDKKKTLAIIHCNNDKFILHDRFFAAVSSRGNGEDLGNVLDLDYKPKPAAITIFFFDLKTGAMKNFSKMVTLDNYIKQFWFAHDYLWWCWDKELEAFNVKTGTHMVMTNSCGIRAVKMSLDKKLLAIEKYKPKTTLLNYFFGNASDRIPDPNICYFSLEKKVRNFYHYLANPPMEFNYPI